MKIAFIFPGQASQKVGMGLDFYSNTEMGKNYFDLADDIMGSKISDVILNGPEETLKQTRYTQPAIYIVSVITGQLLLEKGIKPAAVAGHSLGEYSALTIAGAFDFATGLELVKLRAASMQEAGQAQTGAMAAIIGLDESQVEQVCQKATDSGIVVVANFNAPGQIVISGSVAGVHSAMTIAKEYGARKVIELNVSGAFHSPLMTPAREKLAQKLADTMINDLTIPVYSNVTTKPVTIGSEIRKNLINQLENPVRWQASISNMGSAGITNFIEVGPGRVLQGLLRRINRKFEVSGIESLTDIDNYKDV
ncbi:MAG: ACP S-malonyltransferase [Candidatus Marinimicrobia bacterium]|nr:ACP S-malonyltransferase [Candidatus Neomarinimicrobiota bacterium]